MDGEVVVGLLLGGHVGVYRQVAVEMVLLLLPGGHDGEHGDLLLRREGVRVYGEFLEMLVQGVDSFPPPVHC